MPQVAQRRRRSIPTLLPSTSTVGEVANHHPPTAAALRILNPPPPSAPPRGTERDTSAVMAIAARSVHHLRHQTSDDLRSKRDISSGPGKTPLGRTSTGACTCRDKALHALSTPATWRSATSLAAGLTHDTKLSTRPGAAKRCREPHGIASDDRMLCRYPMAMSNALPPGPSRSPAPSLRSPARSRPFPSSGSSRPALTAIPRRNTRPVSPSYILDTDATSSWMRVAEDGNSAYQGEKPPQGSAAEGNRAEVADSRPNTKRQLPLTASHGNNGDDDYNDGRENRDELKRVKRSNNGSPMLACPFYKHDPMKHGASRVCAGPGWNTTHRVKEHVFRRHRKLGPQCERCFKRFDKEADLQAHLVPTTCSILDQSLAHEDVNVRQEKELRKRKQRGLKQTEKDRWDEMYSILFPNEKIPSCYYQEEQLDAETSRLEQYAMAMKQHAMATVPDEVLAKLRDTTWSAGSAGMEYTIREAVKSSLEACFRDFREQPTRASEEMLPMVAFDPFVPLMANDSSIWDSNLDYAGMGSWYDEAQTLSPSVLLPAPPPLADDFNTLAGAALDSHGNDENVINLKQEEQAGDLNLVPVQEDAK